MPAIGVVRCNKVGILLRPLRRRWMRDSPRMGYALRIAPVCKWSQQTAIELFHRMISVVLCCILWKLAHLPLGFPTVTVNCILLVFFVLNEWLISSRFYSKNTQYDTQVHGDLSTHNNLKIYYIYNFNLQKLAFLWVLTGQCGPHWKKLVQSSLSLLA